MLKNYSKKSSAYYEAREWLEKYIPQTYTKRELGLERICYLLKLLGNPEKKFKSIHIAGTSGKGSAAFYTARLLERSKLEIRNSKLETNSEIQISKSKTPKIGLHISPHLIDIRERMQINGKLIPMNKFIKLIEFIKPKVESMAKSKVGLPSYFEILVAASFKYFADEKVDWAVVEVGLGGRLDATNVLQSRISVITNVGLDHTDILGKTTEKIAFEKAGIIKPHTPVVTGASGKAFEVIKNTAKKQKSELITKDTLKVQNKVYFDELRYIKDYLDIHIGNKLWVPEQTLMLVNLVLWRLGFNVSEDIVKKTFSEPFGGRFELIRDGILVDGAHNRDKVRVLIKWVQRSLQVTGNQGSGPRIQLVCAFKKGKDWKGILRLLFNELDIERVYASLFNAVTDTGFLAAVKPKDIKSFIESKSKRVKVRAFENSQEAVFSALNAKRSNTSQVVLITGSLYLAGEARTLWELPGF